MTHGTQLTNVEFIVMLNRMQNFGETVMIGA